MSQKTGLQDLRILVKNGVQYADPFHDERYLVKLFPLPQHTDLAAHIRLMESYERRFLHTADGGRLARRHGNIDAFIDQRRKAYQEKTGGDKELEGAALCIALQDRGICYAKEHMAIRMQMGDGPTEGQKAALGALAKKVEDDLMEAFDTFECVRRKRGHKDVDQVLAEMKGEPYKIFMSTLAKTDEGLVFFRRNRMYKAANAMKCVDAVVDMVSGLAVSHKKLEDEGMLAMLTESGEAAKARLQLQRDDPDFAAADRRLLVARNSLLQFSPKTEKPLYSTHLPADYLTKGQVSPTTMALLREAADLIYDVALVRLPRNVSALDLAARVGEHRPDISRALRTG